MRQWAAREFGIHNAEAVARVMEQYYRLAFIRKPEFMGWSQTEPTTPTRTTAFSAFMNGDEISRRLDAYQALVREVRRLAGSVPSYRQSAFFELVAYPVEGAAFMNEKFLYAQKSRLYARYALPVADAYARLSEAAYDSIKAITRVYNLEVAGGKWNHVMSMAPRDLPVFGMPELPGPVVPKHPGMLLWLEGQPAPMEDTARSALPRFNPYSSGRHFIMVFNRGKTPLAWHLTKRDKWIIPAKTGGILDSAYKLNISIDWKSVPRGCTGGSLSIAAKDSLYTVRVLLAPRVEGKPPLTGSAVERDGHVFIQAAQYADKRDVSPLNRWTVVKGLGFSDRACGILPVPAARDSVTDSSWLAYRFYTFSKGAAEIRVFTLPTLPVDKDGDQRIGISVDGGPIQVKSFKTEGRTEAWKQHVLRNQAISVFPHDFRRAGYHTLKLYALDPGVIIDQLSVDFGPEDHFYTIPAGK
jgi:hypothetical protein